jgi:hypothetical protein
MPYRVVREYWDDIPCRRAADLARLLTIVHASDPKALLKHLQEMAEGGGPLRAGRRQGAPIEKERKKIGDVERWAMNPVLRRNIQFVSRDELFPAKEETSN